MTNDGFWVLPCIFLKFNRFLIAVGRASKGFLWFAQLQVEKFQAQTCLKLGDQSGAQAHALEAKMSLAISLGLPKNKRMFGHFWPY